MSEYCTQCGQALKWGNAGPGQSFSPGLGKTLYWSSLYALICPEHGPQLSWSEAPPTLEGWNPDGTAVPFKLRPVT